EVAGRSAASWRSSHGSERSFQPLLPVAIDERILYKRQPRFHSRGNGAVASRVSSSRRASYALADVARVQLFFQHDVPCEPSPELPGGLVELRLRLQRTRGEPSGPSLHRENADDEDRNAHIERVLPKGRSASRQRVRSGTTPRELPRRES